MNWICIGAACLGALCLYLASPHQALWRAALAWAVPLRWAALPIFICAVAAATQAYGLWCAAFIAASGFMTMLVLLPYLDAWLRTRKATPSGGARHVG